jgi:16S rRNA (cytidine1402-2'-O)-methyltransferase
LEVLKECDLILSEDTRETEKVLKAYDITKKQISYRDQNHDRVLPYIVTELEAGKKLALVSDNGTPLISDPGFKLIRELASQGYAIISVPGPSALVAGLTVSGLPSDKFCFLGFLPRSSGPRQKLLRQYGDLDCTLIIYESPFRITKLLEESMEVLGDREVCLVNDLTKLFEKVTSCRLSALIEGLKTTKLKGEFILYIAKKGI